MRLHLTLDGDGPRRDRLYRALRRALLDGRLVADERLPPSRALAAELGLGRQTVVEAYERLIAEGFLAARTGSGTFVARLNLPVSRESGPTAGAGPGAHWRTPATWGEVRLGGYNFAGGVTDPALLPWPAWRRAVQRALRDQAADTTLYGDPVGQPALRAGIADYLGYSRGLPCRPESVLVTQGAQQGLDLLARVRVGPGDLVAVEEPGYPPARAVFEQRGATVVGVPVDEQGVCVDRIPERATLVYVTPSHQFPLGMPLSLSRRLALLERANRHDWLIVEDDYDGEYRFEGRPLEALKSLDRDQRVAYLGTFSKVLHPALRLGYVVMPEGLRQALTGARRLADGYGGDLNQRALAHLIGQGDFARHLQRMQRIYQRRRDALREALAAHPERWRPLPALAGIHLAVRLRDPAPDWRRRLATADATVLALDDFYQGEAPPGLLLGFGALPDSAVGPGVDALARALGTPPGG